MQANKGRGIEQLKQTIVATLDRNEPYASSSAGASGSDGQGHPARRLDAHSSGAALGENKNPLTAGPSPRGRGETAASLVRNAPTFPDAFELEVAAVAQRLDGGYPPALARRLLLDVGGQTERLALEAKGAAYADHLHEARQRLASAGCGVPGIEARTRYAWIRRATEGCISRPEVRKVTWTDRIDKTLTHPIWGTLVFLAVMLVVFTSIF
jgi:ferrous iron transport protein B